MCSNHEAHIHAQQAEITVSPNLRCRKFNGIDCHLFVLTRQSDRHQSHISDLYRAISLSTLHY